MIILPWPPRELHPNARPHFHAKAQATKAYRIAATYTALAEGPDFQETKSTWTPTSGGY